MNRSEPAVTVHLLGEQAGQLVDQLPLGGPCGLGVGVELLSREHGLAEHRYLGVPAIRLDLIADGEQLQSTALQVGGVRNARAGLDLVPAGERLDSMIMAATVEATIDNSFLVEGPLIPVPRRTACCASGSLSGNPGRHGLERHDGHVVYVSRLVTFVEVDDTVADPRQMSVSARHEAVLMNGGRVLLPADRGWSASGPPNIWAVTSVEEIADTARMVVGPDEPFGGRSQKDMEADHWASLATVLGARALTRTPWS